MRLKKIGNSINRKLNSDIKPKLDYLVQNFLFFSILHFYLNLQGALHIKIRYFERRFPQNTLHSN